ncbi:hypothetical protein [Deinococcus sp. QL22]|uniref:hypothetical protein n=1 Tax=Deinococcus sp. QL22 TaxID=2939437 RepID=UPI002016FDFE|nr:hypothetical protein [Deinococcus sp. QL22]UQN05505.1 hypothetical protein M1R55_11525 [Deinococcus sp. QL22]
MTSEELSVLLQSELKSRNWSVDDLAERAGVAYETARRATQSIGSISLASTNKLLVAVGKRMTIIEFAFEASA